MSDVKLLVKQPNISLDAGTAPMDGLVEWHSSPVIVITGTPGTGKSTHAHLLVEESPVPLQHINVGDWVKEKGFYTEYDEEWQSYTVDEDKVRRLRSLYRQASDAQPAAG